MPEPRGLYRTHGKRPEGVTMISWVNGWCGMSRLGMLLKPVAWIKAPYATQEPSHDDQQAEVFEATDLEGSSSAMRTVF